MTPGMQQTVQHNQHYTAHTDDDNNNDEGVSFNFHIAASTSNQKFTFNMTDIESKLRDAPDKYLFFVAHYLAGHINDTDAMDHLNGPLLKSSIKSIYWIFVMQYALLAFLGIVMNVAIIAHIGYHRMFKDVTHAFIANLALCHVVQCAVVLPVTLMVMLIQNWIFGQFLCFFLPMLQDIPLHVALITHILIAWDRMRWLSDPLKCRIPAFVCCCATWLTGMVIALPYPIYTIYVEIGDFLPRLHGVGLCVVNLMDDMHEYMRGLFFLMYCAPALLLAYIYIKTSQELRPPIGPIAEYRAEIRMRQRNSSTSSVERSYSNATTATAGAIKIPTYSTGTATRTYDLYNAELDLYREKHNQRTFGGMAAAQIFCICPLMVLRFARLSLEETYENQKHFDFTYLMLVWIAFLPTIIFPFIYGTQILPRTDRKRFRDYFNLSMKRLPKTTQNVINENNLDEYRENAIEKDESTNVSQRTSIILNGDNNTSELCGTSRDRIIEKMHEVIKTVPQFQYNKDIKHDPYSNQFTREQEQKGESLDDYETAVANSYLQNCLKMERTEEKVQTTQTQNRSRINRNDLKIPPVCDASNKFRTLYRSQGPTETSINCNNSNIREGCDAKLTQLKVNLDSLDNWSFSNATASTYCNGTESYRNDDADASNFGDGDDSSIVSDILVSDPLSGSGIGLPPYSNSKMSSYTDILKSRVISTSDFSNYSCMNSANTISSEMNILNFSERNPSGMDKSIREHRRLPNIEKFCYGSPNNNKVPVTPVNTLSAKVPVVNINNPLGPHRDTLSRTGTLITELSSEYGQSMSRSTKTSFEEDIPSDYDDCKKENDPITHKTMESTPVNSPVEIQYQYCRRANRKSLHFHNNITNPCHRLYKRENFNSLQNNDLIAGAFGELDPTQPLTKMSVIENRIMMQRSSGINREVNGGNSSSGRKSTSFLATGRSSSKSRDFSQSSHSAQPELDFRENIFAEL